MNKSNNGPENYFDGHKKDISSEDDLSDIDKLFASVKKPSPELLSLYKEYKERELAEHPLEEKIVNTAGHSKKDKASSWLKSLIKMLQKVGYGKRDKASSWIGRHINVEQFCGKLYDNCVFFSAHENSKENQKAYWGYIYLSIKAVDKNFHHIELDTFAREMTALQYELFGLAWMHHFTAERYHGFEEKATLSEIVFTKNYMEKHGYSEIWNIMSYYNKTIADALLYHCITAEDRPFPSLIAIEDEMSYYITQRNFNKKLREDGIDNWKKKVDLDCATRVANRISTREVWGGCPIARMLAMTFAERLGWKVDLRAEGFAGFEQLIDRIYNDLKREINREYLIS